MFKEPDSQKKATKYHSKKKTQNSNPNTVNSEMLHNAMVNRMDVLNNAENNRFK